MIASFLLGLTQLASSSIYAMPPDEDPQVNSINREPARAQSFPLLAERPPFEKTDAWETPYVAPLEGTWQFLWLGSAGEMPTDTQLFLDTTPQKWSPIKVPACVELEGYGVPFNIGAPGVPTPNISCIYKRSFEVPKIWGKRPVFIRFDGVYSCFWLYINGKFVGYSEDSKLPSEFNISNFMKPGANDVVVKVKRRCDGARLEDPGSGFTGIFRPVSLFSPPATELNDFSLSSAFCDSPEGSATLDVALRVRTLKDKAFKGTVSAELWDDKHQVVQKVETAPFSIQGEGTFQSVNLPQIRVPDVYKWSADAPYLYTVVLALRDAQKKIIDVRCVKHGFRTSAVVNGRYLLNGKPIKIKGVNRQEHNAETGCTVTREQMVEEIIRMKQSNINAVRTIHCPNHHEFYDLCDRYGLYVIAEANLESVGVSDGEPIPSDHPSWARAFTERNTRHVDFYKNHPCIIMWSLGNGTHFAENSRTDRNYGYAASAVKKMDSSRPIHLETGAHSTAFVDSLDFFSENGPSLEQVRQMSESKLSKPYFLNMFVSSRGNAVGNLADYWSVIEGNDQLAGGCIGNWMDEGLLTYSGRLDAKKKSETYYRYGPAGVSGLVQPDLKETPKLREVRRVYQNIDVMHLDSAPVNVFHVKNNFYFKNLKYFDIRWTLFEDGFTLERGILDAVNVRPGQVGKFTVPLQKPRLKKAADYQIAFAFILKKSTRWAPRDFEIAYVQLKIPADSQAVPPAQMTLDGARDLIVSENQNSVTVQHSGDQRFSISFDRNTGTISRLVRDGVAVIQSRPEQVAGPRLNIYRAFTDNDAWLAEDFRKMGLDELRYHPTSMTIQNHKNRVVVVTSMVRVFSAQSPVFDHESIYTIFANNVIRVENKITPLVELPALPRLGVRMFTTPTYETVHWYGRGPTESYPDRATGSDLGLYSSAVSFQYVDYIRPQENGSKFDVAWFALTDNHSRGLLFVSESQPLMMNALHYTANDLDKVCFSNRGKVQRTPMVPCPETVLCVDMRQSGVGSAGDLKRPLEKDIIRLKKGATYSFTYSIRPAWTRPENLSDEAHALLPKGTSF